MADDELDLDTSEKKGKGKLIMLVVIVLLLLGIAVAATLYFTGALGGDKKQGENQDEQGDEKTFVAKPALYMALEPEFVVNFEDNSKVSYMQVEIQVMAREQPALDELNRHMPVIRNNILLLLSTQKYEEINTVAGKEALRQAILNSIQQVIDQEVLARNKNSAEETDKEKVQPPKIEAVYFTSLIMQ